MNSIVSYIKINSEWNKDKYKRLTNKNVVTQNTEQHLYDHKVGRVPKPDSVLYHNKYKQVCLPQYIQKFSIIKIKNLSSSKRHHKDSTKTNLELGEALCNF